MGAEHLTGRLKINTGTRKKRLAVHNNSDFTGTVNTKNKLAHTQHTGLPPYGKEKGP